LFLSASSACFFLPSSSSFFEASLPALELEAIGLDVHERVLRVLRERHRGLWLWRGGLRGSRGAAGGVWGLGAVCGAACAKTGADSASVSAPATIVNFTTLMEIVPFQ
jgi:hypothetical protein